MKKQKRNQENIELELKLEEMNVQKKIQKLSEKEFKMKNKKCCVNLLIVNKKNILYTYVFYLLLVILKMAYEEIGTRHGKKCYHMPHMKLLDDDRKKIRFTNYDKYDRRKAHKKFLDASYLRHKIDDEEDVKNIVNDLVTSRFMMMTQSSYGQMIDEAMKTFVTREQELSSVEIRGKMTLNLKYLLKI